ncbi:MAG TPA: antibiotic biosynthesis monooxygenase [Terriglobia bacterium]|nr:antibiotic biosynthesis monooxygenase [Terriglobia bacterium]
MLRKTCVALFLAVLTAVAALGQEQSNYLDVYVARVKPEKRAEFDAIEKKIAEASRRHRGDTWVAMETLYGEQNTISFISTRRNYAEVESSFATFEGALDKAFGAAGAAKLLQDLNNTLIGVRAEVRRRRWDLSYNAPADAAAYAQVVGKMRWLRSIVIRVRPGHAAEFEALLKDINAASQKNNQPGMRWVSVVADGGNPNVYYIARLLTSLGELDQGMALPEMLGEEGFQKFQKVSAESVAGVEFTISRILPELSNPPETIAAVAPDFWNPKPKAAAKPKAKAAENKAPSTEQP